MRLIAIILTCCLFYSCKMDEKKQVEKYSIDQFYKNKRIGGGVFSPDESHLLVSSDESGIFNLYEINIETGSKRQVTHSEEESFFAVDYVPGTNNMLYSADKGGNEMDHIYLLGEDGSSKDLTPGEKEKASFVGWSRDKRSMYYISNKRNPQFFDFYKMPVGDWDPEMLYQNDEGMDLSGMSDDENILALQKTITTSENQLFLYNRSGQSTIEISKPELPGNYSSSGFSKDGRHFYYITNAGKEFAYLMQLEISSGKEEVLYETNWDVMYSYLSENEKYRIIAINEDGKNSLIIQNNVTGEQVDFPQIPDGNVLAVNVSDSEKQMRLSIGTSKAPTNLYVY
ncbi:S9 family peptidase, partial [Cytophagales bacterium RKSG123]